MRINYPLLALAIGTLGIGTTEFSPMDPLSIITRGVDVSIPAAGTLISAYTAGITISASLMTPLPSYRAHRSVPIFLMAIFTLDDVLSAIALDYIILMLPRILTGLNHGAFFSLGSVVAVSVVPKHKQASAVATMFTGLTLINIGDVPAAIWLGETIGWRMSFLIITGLDMISMVSLFLSLPEGGAGAQPEVKKKLAVLICPQILPTLLTTVLGTGTVLTLYTYIFPILQSITHATPMLVTAMLVLIGIGFSIGNYFGGKLAGRSVNGMLKGFLLLLMVIVLAIPFLARNGFDIAINMVVWGVVASMVVPPLQIRVMRVAGEAPGLSSSVNIGAFNLGDALGAAASGAVVSARLGYNFVPVIGVIVAGLALLLVFISARK